MSLHLLKTADKIPLEPIIALIGPETLIRRRIQENLIARALQGALKDMNFSQFQAGEDDMHRVVEACQDYPCFAERRVIVLREAGALKAKDAPVLSAYFERPQPTTLLILEDEKFDGRLEWVKKLKKKAYLVEVSACDRSELAAWLRDAFHGEGKKASPEVIERLLDWVGSSLEALQSTVAQCCLYIGDAPELKLQDIENLLVKVTEENIFEVIDAIFTKNTAELRRRLEALLETGEEPLKVLALIHRHLSILLALKFTSTRQAGTVFRMPPMAWRKYEQQVLRYGKKINVSLWMPLAKADVMLKGSVLPRELILKNSVDEIIRLLA